MIGTPEPICRQWHPLDFTVTFYWRVSIKKIDFLADMPATVWSPPPLSAPLADKKTKMLTFFSFLCIYQSNRNALKWTIFINKKKMGCGREANNSSLNGRAIKAYPPPSSLMAVGTLKKKMIPPPKVFFLYWPGPLPPAPLNGLAIKRIIFFAASVRSV